MGWSLLLCDEGDLFYVLALLCFALPCLLRGQMVDG